MVEWGWVYGNDTTLLNLPSFLVNDSVWKWYLYMQMPIIIIEIQ